MASIQDSFNIGSPSLRSGLPPARGSGSNLFIAARPNLAAAAAAHSLGRDMRDKYRIGGQPLSMSRLHVSLVRLGIHQALPDSLVYHAREALDGLIFEPFEILFDRIAAFRSNASHPVVLCSDRQDARLKETVTRLAHKLDGLGVECSWNPDFIAHMTLIYHTSAVVEERLASPIRWTVDGFWLIDSLLGHGTCRFLWPPQEGRDAA